MTRNVCATLLTMLLLTTACEQPRAHGDVNALIVGASPELWTEVEGVFLDAMEPTVQTVTNERPFRITHQDPTESENWGNLQRFRQVLVLGDRTDPWIQQALDEARQEVGSPPTLLQVGNVWARGQQVSVLLLPEENQVQAVESLASDLRQLLDSQFRSYARSRMFVSGVNEALADSLAQNVGFSLRLPQVYRQTRTDSVIRFRNDNPSPTELIREVAVTWRSPLPEENPTRSDFEEWRPELTREYYNDPQDLDTTVVSYGPIEVNGHQGVEYQSAWANPPEGWPAGGPFISRAVRCPDQDRLYLMDAWVYAPDRSKYEYVIQLETILDSFRCH